MSDELKAVESSACNELFDDLLSTYYTPLEVWYTRSAVDKVLPFLYLHFTMLKSSVGAPPFESRCDIIAGDNDHAGRCFLHLQSCPFPTSFYGRACSRRANGCGVA
jgi:hypothetical protein